MVNSIKLSILLSDFLRYKGLWEYRTYCKAFFTNIYEMVNEINVYSNKIWNIVIKIGIVINFLLPAISSL